MEAATAERTSIKITSETWAQLNALKRPGDTFDDVIRRLLLLQQRESASAARPK